MTRGRFGTCPRNLACLGFQALAGGGTSIDGTLRGTLFGTDVASAGARAFSQVLHIGAQVCQNRITTYYKRVSDESTDLVRTPYLSLNGMATNRSS